MPEDQEKSLNRDDLVPLPNGHPAKPDPNVGYMRAFTRQINETAAAEALKRAQSTQPPTK